MTTTLPVELLIAELFDAQPESVVWFKPIFAEDNDPHKKTIVDFETGYCNNAACTFLQAPKEAIINQRLLNTTLLDGGSSKLIFDQCVQVYETGTPQEFTYYNEHLQRYYSVLRSKVKDGVLSVSRDQTKQYLMSKELEQQARRFNTIIDTSIDGILLLQSVRDANNNIINFKIAHCNKAGCLLGKLPVDVMGKNLLEVLPHMTTSEQFELHKKVVETGIPVQFETTFRNEEGLEYGWFIVSLLKLDDGILSRFLDITEKKENEKKIIRQAEFLNRILEASINAVFAAEAIRDENGKVIDLLITKINQGFTRLTGKTAAVVEGNTFLSLFKAAKDTPLFDLQLKVLETGAPLREEVYYRGEIVDGWFDLSMARLGENGLVVSFADITKSKQAWAEIEQQRNLLDSILKNSPSGISVTKVIRDENNQIIDGHAILVNEAATRYTGIAAELYLTKPLSEIDPNILTSSLYLKSVNTLQTGEPFIMQYKFEAQGKWLEVAVSKMDEDHLVSVFADVTEIKESHLKLEKLVEELKRSNAQLEEFTYAASHDLKEPIRKVSIFANRLRNLYSTMENTDATRTLERLQFATERMQLLVDDLLEYSHISILPMEPEEIDLNEKLERVLADLELVIEEKKAKIEIDKLPVIKGFRRQIQQLFQNLISNALKYTKPGVEPVIKISVQEVKGAEIKPDISPEEGIKTFYLIEVKDNGIGFNQQYAERIFNMFQRLHGKSEYSGSGVGLSIARKVAENHQGYITAESEPDKGATFKVYLPK